MENIEVHVEDEELGIYTYTLESPAGIKVTVTNYGAAVYRILAPDRNGRLEEIALSCDTMEDFRKNTAFSVRP